MAKITSLHAETMEIPAINRSIHIPAISATIVTDDGKHQGVVIGLCNIFPRDEASAIKNSEEFLASLLKSHSFKIEK